MHLSVTLWHSSGTGAVTHEMAIAYPKATVYGVSLSPAPRPIPSNTNIITGSVLEVAGKAPLTHCTLDLVHYIFLLYGMINWQVYVAAAASLVKPGGYIEVQKRSLRYNKDGGIPNDESMPRVQVLQAVASPFLAYSYHARSASCIDGSCETDCRLFRHIWQSIISSRNDCLYNRAGDFSKRFESCPADTSSRTAVFLHDRDPVPTIDFPGYSSRADLF